MSRLQRVCVIVGVDARSFKLRARIVRPPLLEQCEAKVEVGVGIIGVAEQCLAKLGDSVLHLALLEQGLAQFAVGVGARRIDAHRFAKLRDRLFGPAYLKERSAKAEVALRIGGVYPQCFANTVIASSARPRSSNAMPRL